MMQAAPPPPPPSAVEAPAVLPGVPLVPEAAGPAVSAALTDARVSITTGFNGARIVLYGAVFDPQARASDVVVVVRGPDAPIRIVRRTRVAGMWLNTRPVAFEGAPGYYTAASTRPLGDVTGFSTLRTLGLGLSHLRFSTPAETSLQTTYGVQNVMVNRLGADYPLYRQAVLRLQERRGLYAADSRGVRFVDRGLFRAEIDLPAEAPTGRYIATIHLFQAGRPVSTRTLALNVEKIGVERWLYLFAQERPWTYGLLTVLVAIGSGWLAAFAFRRR